MASVGSMDRSFGFIFGAVFVASAFLPPFAAGDAGILALTAGGVVMIGTAFFRIGAVCSLPGGRTCLVSPG
jgi:hypothetical protein